MSHVSHVWYVCVRMCNSCENKRGHAAGRRTHEFRKGSQMSRRLFQITTGPLRFFVVSFRFRQLSFVAASLSFCSARVSVGPTVAVRVTLE